MTTPDNFNSVRAFVRNLNVVVKQVNLYGLNHKQVAPQLETAWKELRTTLNSGRLMLTGAGDHLLLNGKPINAGSADKAFAQILTGSGLAGVCFFPEVTFEQFGEFVKTLALTKPQELLAEFKRHFGTKAAIRLLEFHIGGEETGDHSMNLAGHIAAAMLGTVPEVTNAKPATTTDLLRVLVAMDAKGSGGAGASTTSAVAEHNRELGEEDVLQTIRWLAKLGGKEAETTNEPSPALDDLPTVAQDALRKALSAPAAEQIDPEQPALVSLAEQLAVKMALDKYERGEIQLNAVGKMLERLKLEIAKLHGVIQSQEDKLFQAGVSTEDDALDQQFWAGVPTRNKLQMLLSHEGYCVPARNVAAFIDELLGKSDRNTAEQVLRNYCALLRGEAELEAKLKVARGISTLAESYAKVSDRVVQWAMAVVASALSRNLSGDLGLALSDAMAALGRQVSRDKNYPVLRDYFDQLSGLRTLSEAVTERIWAEADFEGAASRFVEDAVNALEPKPDLLEALKQMPGAVANELKNRAANCTKREDYRRLSVLSNELGSPVLELLKQSAKTEKPDRALLASGLLAASDTLFVEEILKRRMPGWAPSEQASTIHQIACSGIPERGVLLTQLFESFHELILPQAIDEIGISGSADVEKLVEITGRKGKASPFIQLKVIEALGNLKAKAAIPLMRHIVLAKSVFKFEYARETRIVAMQALLKIDPLSARETLSRSGLTSDDLQLAPLRPGPGDWVRQRRYARIPIEGSVFASVMSSAGSCKISLEAMSMGGGGGSTSSRAQLSPDGMVEMQFGLRKLRARVLLHPIDTYKLGFEIASIPLDDRTRLRQFLASQARA